MTLTLIIDSRMGMSQKEESAGDGEIFPCDAEIFPCAAEALSTYCCH